MVSAMSSSSQRSCTELAFLICCFLPAGKGWSHAPHITPCCHMHSTHQLVTRTSHVSHMLVTSMSHVSHMLVTSIHMLVTSMSHVSHMLVTCMSHAGASSLFFPVSAEAFPVPLFCLPFLWIVLKLLRRSLMPAMGPASGAHISHKVATFTYVTCRSHGVDLIKFHCGLCVSMVERWVE